MNVIRLASVGITFRDFDGIGRSGRAPGGNGGPIDAK